MIEQSNELTPMDRAIRLIRADGSVQVFDGFKDFNHLNAVVDTVAINDYELLDGLVMWSDAYGKERGRPLNHEAIRILKNHSDLGQQVAVYGDVVIDESANWFE